MEELYNTYYKELVGWCSSMTKNPSMAEDLVQETFLRALMNEQMIMDLQPGQQRAWLYRTIKNLYVDKIRHTSFETAVETLPEESREAEAYGEIVNELFLRELPDEEKTLFVMRYLMGYNSKEIGRLFHIPPGTVRQRLSSARKHLKDALKEK